MKILIIDFDDSFTFNIYGQLLALLGSDYQKLEVVNWKFINYKKLARYDFLIWGPGPGHPADYYNSFNSNLKTLLLHKDFFHLGICLGHQLMLMKHDYKIQKLPKPIHGRSLIVELPTEIFPFKRARVQFYNSLGILNSKKISTNNNNQVICEHQNFFWNDILLISWGANYLTYQFHPESVGTSCPEAFFGHAFNIAG